MPSGSRITFREAAAADIPTPDTGQVSLFVDSADSEPKYRDDGGTLHTLEGEDGELTYLNHGNTGASEDIDVSAANIHRLVFDAATVTITFSSWPASGTPGIVRTYIVQDGTGGRLASWPGAVTWGAAGAPTLQTGANAIDIIDFQSVDGGTTVLGSYEVGAAATTAHIADTSDAHDASAISVLDTAANFTGTDVEAVLAELQDNIDGVGGGGVTHDTDEEIMASDVSLGTTVFGNDLMSMSLAAGTWFVIWKIGCNATTAPATVKGILWNDAEDTEYDADEFTTSTSNFRSTGPHGWAIIVLGSTTTVKVSASRTSDNSASAIRDGGNGSSHRMTKMTAVRLAD